MPTAEMDPSRALILGAQRWPLPGEQIMSLAALKLLQSMRPILSCSLPVTLHTIYISPLRVSNLMHFPRNSPRCGVPRHSSDIFFIQVPSKATFGKAHRGREENSQQYLPQPYPCGAKEQAKSISEGLPASSLWRFRKIPGARVNALDALPNVDGDAFYYYARCDACSVPACTGA